MNQAKLPEVASWAGIYTRHKQCEFTCSAVQYGRQKYGLFCKTRPPVLFVMSKFQKQNLVKVPFHFVSQQNTRSSAAVFNRDLKIGGRGRVPVRVFRTEHAHKVRRPTFFEVRVLRTENSYS